MSWPGGAYRRGEQEDKQPVHTGEQVRYLSEGVCGGITEELTFGCESEEARKQLTFQVRW